jgi:hypothetical protein
MTPSELLSSAVPRFTVLYRLASKDRAGNFCDCIAKTILITTAAFVILNKGFKRQT